MEAALADLPTSKRLTIRDGSNPMNLPAIMVTSYPARSKPAPKPAPPITEDQMKAKYRNMSLALGMTLSEEDQKCVDDFLAQFEPLTKEAKSSPPPDSGSAEP
jgi:hypothetical protein